MTKSVLVLALLAASCASGTAVVAGRTRPPTSADAVRVLLKPPADYEAIALVTATSSSGWTAKGGQETALAELKEQAARVGANGVILTATREGARGGLFTGGQQIVEGTAIWTNER